jgi:4-amino-4-deoxychorismate lyase
MDFALIETLRWEPPAGFARADLHFARIAASAKTFGFPFRRDSFEAALLQKVSATNALRVRAELPQDGTVSVTTAPFTPVDTGTVWRLKLASVRLDSKDPMLRHKTTRRDAYTAARAEYAASQAEEILLLNERGELCDGTITNLFVRMNPGEQLLTPRVESGLLPGILRQEYLETDVAIETVIRPERLLEAAEIYVGNSLRGLIRARFEPEA